MIEAVGGYINNSNKSLPTEKCLLIPFWKAVNYSTLKGRDHPVKHEHLLPSLRFRVHEEDERIM